MNNNPIKPIGRKNYGSIPHLPNSRMGPADHACHEGQARIATIKVRDKHDRVFVTEKLDGSNVGIARVGNEIIALQRAGYLASSSPYEQHQLFANWVKSDEDRWRACVHDGERLVGEWLAQAHSTRYSLPQGPFVAFDIMREEKRLPFMELCNRAEAFEIPLPKLISLSGVMSVDDAMIAHGGGVHGLLDEAEGVAFRVERKGEFDFMVKWVRPDKVDGKFLPEISGGEPIWNWRPENE